MTAPVLTPTVAAHPARRCQAFVVQSGQAATVSVLLRVDLPSGTATRLGELDHRLDAIGHAGNQGLTYGIAGRGRKGRFTDGGHVVTIDDRGRVADLGPIRATGPVPVPRGGLAGASAGAVAGDRWYLREADVLYTIDIDPGSRSYLGVLRAVRLSPTVLTRTVADFAADPARGLLYGISTSGFGSGIVVGIDPLHGTARAVAAPPGLPGVWVFGSVVLGADRTLYAINAKSAGRSPVFGMSLGASAPAMALGTLGPGLADAAGCLTRTPASPPAPSTTPPAEPVPAPPPTAAPAPADQPPAITAGSAPPAPAPVLGAPPSRAASAEVSPAQAIPIEPANDHGVRTMRRWSLAALMLIIGGALAARVAGRAR